MADKPKYIQDAIAWMGLPSEIDGLKGLWVRCTDLNLVTTEKDSYYISAHTGWKVNEFRTVFPYEDWMEEYIGTDKDLASDERLKKE